MANNLTINEQKNEGLKRELEVVIPANTIAEQVQLELKKIGKNVKIPGFRPGKVPMSMLEKRYGDSVMGEVIEKSVNDAIVNAVTSRGEKTALPPKAEIKSFEKGGDLVFTMSYEVLPEMPEVDFTKIELERQVVKISDEEIQDSMENLADANKTLKEKAKTAKAKKGDVVKIDFEGFVDGEAFEGGKGEGFNLEIGSGQFIAGFEEQLIGAKAGDEVEVKVTFPEDYHSKELAGKDARFVVKLHAVQEAVKAEIDDELAKKLGFENIDAVKEFVAGKLEENYKNISRTKLKKRLFDELEKLCDFEIPETMEQMEFDNIWQQYEQAKLHGQVAEEEEEKTEEELKEDYRAIAKRRVMLGLFLAHVASNNNIEVSQQELSAAIFAQARNYPPEEARKIFEFYQKNPEHLRELQGPILEEKAVDLILDKAKIKDVEVSKEELLSSDELSIDGATAGSKSSSKKGSKKKTDKKAAKKTSTSSTEVKTSSKAKTKAKTSATQKKDSAKSESKTTKAKKTTTKEPTAKKKAAS